MTEYVSLAIGCINVILLIWIALKAEAQDRTEEVLIAVKKSRELQLEAINGLRQHVAVSLQKTEGHVATISIDVAATRLKLNKLSGL